MSSVPPLPNAVPPLPPSVPSRVCPKCAMQVPAAAYVCPYCRKQLRTSRGLKGCLFVFGGLVALGWLGSLVSPKAAPPVPTPSAQPATRDPVAAATNAPAGPATKKAPSVDVAKLLRELRASKDEMRGITFYYHPESSRYVNSRSELYAYFGVESNGRPTSLRFVASYVAEEWLFVQKFLIKADEQRFVVAPGMFKIERDNSGGKIWEWYDTSVGVDDLAMLSAVAIAKSATIRYDGRQYYKDRAISVGERARLKKVLETYLLVKASREP